MLMTYGLFVFGLDTVGYQELQRQTAWRHAAQARVGKRPVRQFLGPGDDMITLSGVLMPEFTGGQQHLDDLRRMADEGAAWPLIEGTGRFYGVYVIESMTERQSHHMADGAAQRIQFDLTLSAVDEDRPDLLGDINSAPNRRMLGLA